MFEAVLREPSRSLRCIYEEIRSRFTANLQPAHPSASLRPCRSTWWEQSRHFNNGGGLWAQQPRLQFFKANRIDGGRPQQYSIWDSRQSVKVNIIMLFSPKNSYLSFSLHNPISVMASVEPPVKRKRGRPPGRKNKNKMVETSKPSRARSGERKSSCCKLDRWMIVSVFLTPLIKTGEDSVIGLILLLTCWFRRLRRITTPPRAPAPVPQREMSPYCCVRKSLRQNSLGGQMKVCSENRGDRSSSRKRIYLISFAVEWQFCTNTTNINMETTSWNFP